MDCISARLPYRQTGYFTKIVLDYIDQAEQLKPFYSHSPSLQGIQKAIESRKQFATKRKILVDELKKQYSFLSASVTVKKNIELLVSENSFTITTAHQPNIFTGPLYFVYKILHAIKLAKHCKDFFPQYDFIPVYYMGSEDADLEELGSFYLNGEKFIWNTKQTGAVGRMKVDREFLKLIEIAGGQIIIHPFGEQILTLIKECYKEGETIQNATFKLVNALFGEYGLIVLIPDNAALKKQVEKIFADDLKNQTPSEIVQKTAVNLFSAGYKLQANPREVNLFYLEDGVRDRIVRKSSEFKTLSGVGTEQKKEWKFSEKEILKELYDHPERFSPNVILRGIYQETILPNVVYIGGGGEIAYWLQLKELFENYKVPFPVLLLRNSFLILEKKCQEKISKLGFVSEDLFLNERELMSKFVEKESKNEIKLNGNFTNAEHLYETLKKQAAAVDISLAQHVDALKAKSLHRLLELEKKMLRAEKRKFSDQQRQIHTIKEKLFPQNNLQERIENFIYYYATWGKNFIDQLYKHSLSLEQEFVIMNET